MKKSISPSDEVVVRITAHYVEQIRSGQRPCLSDYLVRYPDYTDALVDFVAYYHVLEEHVSSETNSREALSEVSQLALEHVCSSGEDNSCQLITLFMKRDSQHFSLSDLAKELDLGVDVVMQLEQRCIDPGSIPLELFRQLARILQQPAYVIQTYFADNSLYGLYTNRRNLQQKIAELQETYSVFAKKSVQPVSFRQALVTSTQMSEQQKDIWRKIIEHENM